MATGVAVSCAKILGCSLMPVVFECLVYALTVKLVIVSLQREILDDCGDFLVIEDVKPVASVLKPCAVAETSRIDALISRGVIEAVREMKNRVNPLQLASQVGNHVCGEIKM